MDGGKTAEEMADMQTLKDSQQAQQIKIQDMGHRKQMGPGEYSDSDSDAGLPPPIPAKRQGFIPKLSIGGLSLSTVANAAGDKTAEEIADMEMLKKSQ